jgi:Flp pilus assembly protein TadG
MPSPRTLPLPQSRSQQGAAALEFAILAPVMVILIVSSIELGFAIRDQLRVQAASAAGAFYAMNKGFDSAGISAAVLSGAAGTGLAATPAPVLFCGCPQTTGIAAATCGATCADGIAARQYAQVSASIPRTTVLGSSLGLPATMTAQSIGRLQ